jgi:hypothetical protein
MMSKSRVVGSSKVIRGDPANKLAVATSCCPLIVNWKTILREFRQITRRATMAAR